MAICHKEVKFATLQSNTALLAVSFLTSVISGSAVSNIIRSVRNVPKYGTVP